MNFKESLKRPKLVKYFDFDEIKINYNEEIDVYQMLSMIFGIIAFLLKYKFSIWLSLTFFLANYNQQNIGISQTKYLANFCLICLGYILLYIFPS